MTALLETIAVALCRMNHRISRPAGAYYTCLDCGRRYATPWAAPSELPQDCYVQEGE